MKIKKILLWLLALILIIWAVAASTVAAVLYIDSRDSDDSEEQEEAESNDDEENEDVEEVENEDSEWTITSKKLIDESSYYEVNITYPVLQNYSDEGTQDDFNSFVKDLVDDQAMFIKNFDPIAGTGKMTLEMTFDIKGQSEDLISILMTGSAYTGGAHPNATFQTINYDLKNNRDIALEDLFRADTDYLTTLSEYTITELKDKLSDESLFENIETGASGNEENFQIFNITAKGLLITFSEFQVAPYAVGPQKVEVPYTEFGSSFEAQYRLD